MRGKAGGHRILHGSRWKSLRAGRYSTSICFGSARRRRKMRGKKRKRRRWSLMKEKTMTGSKNWDGVGEAAVEKSSWPLQMGPRRSQQRDCRRNGSRSSVRCSCPRRGSMRRKLRQGEQLFKEMLLEEQLRIELLQGGAPHGKTAPGGAAEDVLLPLDVVPLEEGVPLDKEVPLDIVPM
jgi:hypothetical protein